MDDYKKAFTMALKVDFLEGREEIFAYANALYAAIQWGRTVK